MAGNPAHAILGPWGQHGHELSVTISLPPPDVGTSARSWTSRLENASCSASTDGGRVEPLGRRPFRLVRTGTRDPYGCRVFDRQRAVSHELLPVPHAGSTDDGLIRADPSGVAAWVAYMLTDTGSARRALGPSPLGATAGSAKRATRSTQRRGSRSGGLGSCRADAHLAVERRRSQRDGALQPCDRETLAPTHSGHGGVVHDRRP